MMQSKMIFSGVSASLLLTTLLLGAMPLVAQTPNSSLTGIISDQAGIRLSQAAVSLRNIGTSAEAIVRPNRNGEYRFDNLPAGKYSIRASAKGLTTVQINDVLIQANKIATLNVTLSESRSGPISVVQVSEAPEPVDAPPTPAPVVPSALPAPATLAAPTPPPDNNEDAKIMDPKIIVGEINAVRDRLALSATQQSEVHAIFLERQENIFAIRADNTLSPSDRREKIKAARLDADAKFRALLNENQLDEYEEILRERRERALQRKQEAAAVISSH